MSWGLQCFLRMTGLLWLESASFDGEHKEQKFFPFQSPHCTELPKQHWQGHSGIHGHRSTTQITSLVIWAQVT